MWKNETELLLHARFKDNIFKTCDKSIGEMFMTSIGKNYKSSVSINNK